MSERCCWIATLLNAPRRNSQPVGCEKKQLDSAGAPAFKLVNVWHERVATRGQGWSRDRKIPQVAGKRPPTGTRTARRWVHTANSHNLVCCSSRSELTRVDSTIPLLAPRDPGGAKRGGVRESKLPWVQIARVRASSWSRVNWLRFFSHVDCVAKITKRGNWRRTLAWACWQNNRIISFLHLEKYENTNMHVLGLGALTVCSVHLGGHPALSFCTVCICPHLPLPPPFLYVVRILRWLQQRNDLGRPSFWFCVCEPHCGTLH